ncbi:hypothetical protein L218DRAFT_974772 [Marasmius fiardii PR-910]|nr:hypothetical protein L218DRAFT_974772 [Marasmius fiardii PR-910]
MYHVYSLPPELLQNLTSRNLVLSPQVAEPEVSKEFPSTTASTNTGPRTCNICLGISFADVDQQRVHFRSDWHRYNVKTRLNGGQSVTEQDFVQLLDALEDSISGSESSNQSDGSSDSDAIAALVNKHKKKQPESPTTPDGPHIPQTPIAWFHSPPETQIGVYRTLFPLDTPQSSYLGALHDLQKRTPGGRKWAMFMVAGGHFAGAVTRVSRPEGEEEEDSARSKKPKVQKPKPVNEVLVHKTFHRYTTRRKQGGSQSTNDNAKGPAKSAGALLRRYGEQALRDDIRNLIESWADEINDCELIFIRASASNRKIFLDYDGCVISKGDDRLRTFPFPTRRPTQSEITRCLNELTNAKVSHLTEEALRAQDEAYLASLPRPKPVPLVATTPQPEKARAPQPPKLTTEEEQLRERWDRLLEMVVKGRLEALKSFWTREATYLGGDASSIDIRIPEWAGGGGNEKATTLLQIASYAGQDAVVTWLLEDMHADPTITASLPPGIKEDEESFKSKQVAYDLSKNKPTRDAFRRCAAAHPDWWDWFGAGRLPSALNREMEDERDEKKKARRKGLKERIKERESKEKEKVEVIQAEVSLPLPPTATMGPKRLGGNAGDAQGLAGLTPEMRAKIERERRARAAEARLMKLGGS